MHKKSYWLCLLLNTTFSPTVHSIDNGYAQPVAEYLISARIDPKRMASCCKTILCTPIWKQNIFASITTNQQQFKKHIFAAAYLSHFCFSSIKSQKRLLKFSVVLIKTFFSASSCSLIEDSLDSKNLLFFTNGINLIGTLLFHLLALWPNPIQYGCVGCQTNGQQLLSPIAQAEPG